MSTTWNPADKSAYIDLSESNLVATSNATLWKCARATSARSGGKYEFQFRIVNLKYAANFMIGIGTSAASTAYYLGFDIYGYGMQGSAYKWHNHTIQDYGVSTWATGDTGAVLVDFDAGTLIFKKNGVSLGTAYTGISGTYYPMVAVYDIDDSVQGLFATSDFATAATPGYLAWDDTLSRRWGSHLSGWGLMEMWHGSHRSGWSVAMYPGSGGHTTAWGGLQRVRGHHASGWSGAYIGQGDHTAGWSIRTGGYHASGWGAVSAGSHTAGWARRAQGAHVSGWGYMRPGGHTAGYALLSTREGSHTTGWAVTDRTPGTGSHTAGWAVRPVGSHTAGWAIRGVRRGSHTAGYTATTTGRGAHVSAWAGLARNPGRGSHTSGWTLVEPQSEVIQLATWLVPVGTGEQAIPIESVSLHCDAGSPYWQADLQLVDIRDYARCPLDLLVDLHIGDTAWRLLIDDRQLDRTMDAQGNPADSATLKCLSPAVRLDSPRADPITKTWPAVMAHAAAEEVAGETIDWQVLDWQIAAGRLAFTDATPISILQKLAEAIGGYVESMPDGTLRMRYWFPAKVLDRWGDAAQLTLTDGVLYSTQERPISQRLIDRLRLLDVESTLQDRLEWTVDEADGHKGILRAFPSPWRDGLILSHTRDGPVHLFSQETEVINKEETVEVIKGTASVGYPILEILDHSYLADDLGEVAAAPWSSQITTADPGYSLLRVSYTTKALRARVEADIDTKAQFLLETTNE